MMRAYRMLVTVTIEASDPKGEALPHLTEVAQVIHEAIAADEHALHFVVDPINTEDYPA